MHYLHSDLYKNNIKSLPSELFKLFNLEFL